MLKKCDWCIGDNLYEKYHDEEWGIPVYDDNIFFEFLILEGAQAGLSWITILRKRENYRKAIDNFNYIKISAYKEKKIQELLLNPGIIRNKLKINSIISNAKAFIKVQQEFGSFSDYIWGFVNNTPLINDFKQISELPASTPLSEKISRDLKKRGFKFVGPTIIYSFLQATGIVNDHIKSCFRHPENQKQ